MSESEEPTRESMVVARMERRVPGSLGMPTSCEPGYPWEKTRDGLRGSAGEREREREREWGILRVLTQWGATLVII